MKIRTDFIIPLFRLPVPLNLAKADYNAAKISPAQFLPKEKAWLEQRLAIARKSFELKGLETKLLAMGL